MPLETGSLGRVVREQPHRCERRGRPGSARRSRSRADRQGTQARCWPRPCRGPRPAARTRAACGPIRSPGPHAPGCRGRRHGPPSHDLPGALQLLAAVASERPEDIAGEAFGVHAGQNVLAVSDLAQHHRHVRPAVDEALVRVASGIRRAGVGMVASATWSDELLVRRRYAMRSAIEMSFRPCWARERTRSGQPRHRAVFVDRLAEDPRRVEPASRARSTEASV